MTTRPALLRTIRGRLAVATAAVALAVGASACQVASPITTDLDYDPADGVSVSLGDVVVRDLLIISEGDGAAGVVSGLVVNRGAEEVTVSIQAAEPLSPEVTVPPGGSLRLDGRDPLTGEDGEPVTITAVDQPAGTSLTLNVSTSTGQTDSALVPVLLPEGHYGDGATATS